MSKPYTCRICGDTNSPLRNQCRSCGTVRAEASPVFRVVNGVLKQVECSLTSDGYVETARSYGAEIALMRSKPTRVMVRGLRTVGLTTYAMERD